MIEKRLLMIGVVSYIVIFLFYYPSIFALQDEVQYLSMAYLLREGRIFMGDNDIIFGIPVGYHVPIYPIGQSILLLPLTFLGWKSIFSLSIAFHLLGVLFFVKLMRLFKLENLNLSLLYLFFPAFVLYSRTIMSDIASTTLFLMACYFYFRPKGPKFICGMLLGIMTLLRTANIILCPVFLLISMAAAIKEKKYNQILLLFLGASPFIFLSLGLNYIYYGSPFLVGTSYKFIGMKNFSLAYFLPNFIYYATSLMLMYPLMLLAPFFAKKTRRSESLLLIIFFISSCSLYFFHDRFPNRLLTYIFGIRLLFPIIPLLLLSYAEFLNKILQKFYPATRRVAMFLMLIFLIVSCILINHQHQQLLKKQLALKEAIYKHTEENSTLIYDFNTAELLLKAWGKRRYIRYQGYKDLLGRLKGIAPNKNIYLVKRDCIYAGTEKREGISQEELAQIRQYYNLQEIKQEDGLKIFRLIK